MPAATVTTAAIDWTSGYVVAPDAFYHRALVHLDRDTHEVKISDRQGNHRATYILAPGYTLDEAGRKNQVRGTLLDGGHDFWIQNDPGCTCQGYKRTPR